MTATQTTPDAKATQQLEVAKTFEVANDTQLELAGLALREVKSMQKQVEDTFKPMKQAADAAKREILDKEKLHLAPLQEAERILKQKSLAYTAARDARVAAERRTAEEAARKQAEEAREAERKRLWNEGKRKASQQVAVAPIVVAPVAPPPPAPKVAGISVREVWTFEIVGPVPPAYMTPDLVKIGNLVKSMGAEAAPLLGPGVRVFSKSVMSAKA